MILRGGTEGSNFVSNGGQYDPVGDAWLPTTTIGAPSPRQLHTAVSAGTKMIVWGGGEGADFSNTRGQNKNLSLFLEKLTEKQKLLELYESRGIAHPAP